jgi:tetratricopeptide (TPR) repeat protein
MAYRSWYDKSVSSRSTDRCGESPMTATKDFFISYTGADQAWAEWIADTLERAGRRTVVQAWDFRPGENFLRRMDEALAEADRVLAVLSAAYLRSEYARDEWTAALVRDRGQPDRLLPVRVEMCELPPLLANRIYLDLAGLDEQAATQRLLLGIEPGRVRPAEKLPFPGPGGQAPARTSQFPGRRPTIFHVPPRNPNFTGQGKLLQALRHHLAAAAASAVVQAGAIHGLGGVGKTQLAIEYAHRHAADYDLVWWIPAEQPVAIAGKLAALARRLELRELPSLDEQVTVLFDELAQRDRWLLVYDNAEDPSDLDALRPPAGGGHVLVTSRNPAWGGIGASVRLDVLPRDEAVMFLRQRLGRDDPLLAALAEALGDLPLALEQAAAYLGETHTPPSEYLELLGDRARELFALGRPTNSQQTIATTWTVSFDRVRHQALPAKDLLTLCAFLAPDDIPRDLLTCHPDVLPARLATAVQDRLALQQALGALSRYSLATVTQDTIGMHRLVQAATRNELGGEAAKRWTGVVVRLLLAAFPGDYVEASTWPISARLLPHVIAVAAHAAKRGAEPMRCGRLLTRAADYLWIRAKLQQAKALLEQALAIGEARRGPNHPDVARTLMHLGTVIYDLGDLSTSRTYLERALTIQEARLGPDHLDVAYSLHNLGLVLRSRGDLAGARTVHERALTIREAQLGPDHPKVAQSLNSLGGVLTDLGDLHAARAAIERGLRIREARLGPDDPDVAYSLNHLGLTLRGLGDLVGARAAAARALSIYEARLGPEHPYAAHSLHLLGLVLHDLRNLAGARAASERAVAIRDTALGPDHPATIESRRSLDNIGRSQLQNQKQLDSREAPAGGPI